MFKKVKCYKKMKGKQELTINVHVQGLKRTCKEKKARQGLAKATKSSTYTVGLKESKFPGATRS